MYLEMCEALGTEPDPKDMPVEYDSLYFECQKALECYHLLPSNWSGNGYYLGKIWTGLQAVFDLLKIYDNQEEIMQMLFMIDEEVSKDISRKQKAAEKKGK